VNLNPEVKITHLKTVNYSNENPTEIVLNEESMNLSRGKYFISKIDIKWLISEDWFQLLKRQRTD
jgi:hypothetical protein